MRKINIGQRLKGVSLQRMQENLGAPVKELKLLGETDEEIFSELCFCVLYCSTHFVKTPETKFFRYLYITATNNMRRKIEKLKLERGQTERANLSAIPESVSQNMISLRNLYSRT